MGEFSYDLQIENSNDSTNTIQAHIHAMVRPKLKEESLVISSGAMLDFGDCCAGTWSKQRLVLKNVSDQPVDILFSSDEPSLIFQLKTEEPDALSSLYFDRNDMSLLDRLHDISTVDSFVSDFSNLNSALSTRPSSPIALSRRDSEAPSSAGSFTNLDFLKQSSSSSSFQKLGPDEQTIATSDMLSRKEGENDFTRVEEIQLRPGVERTIEVLYRPEKDSSSFDYLSGRLVSKSFRITLRYSHLGVQEKEKKIIQCKARACTSVIDVSPKELSFGDTDVGTQKSLPLKITNCSELPTRIEIRLISKVLNCFRGELSVPAKQSIEVKIDNYPRKVNPDYKKQLTVVNLLNRDNDQTIQITSSNIDKHRITYHSLFYRLSTSSSTNFIDFGSIILNSQGVRAFTIENITKSILVLELSCSLKKEVIIYEKQSLETTSQHIPQSAQTKKLEKREKLLQSLGDKPKIVRGVSESTSSLSHPKLALKPAHLGSLSSLVKSRSYTDASVTEVTGSEYLDLASSISTQKDPHKASRRRPHTASSFARPRVGSFASDSGDSKVTSATTSEFKAVADRNSSPLNTEIAKPKSAQESNKPKPKIDLQNGTSYKQILELLEASKMTLDNVLSLLENDISNTTAMLSKVFSEEKVVRSKILLLRELQKSIDDARLVPVSQLEIPPEGRKTVYVVFKPTGADKTYIQVRIP
jgi:hypothetical protein